MNNFENEYAQELDIRNLYDTSEALEDENGMETARNQIHKLHDRICAKGRGYARVYGYYKDAKDRGNDLIDISECVHYNEVGYLIADLKDCGITEFVFSSTWSGTMNTLWAMKVLGCEIGELVVINGNHKGFLSEDWEQVPGLLIKIN